MRKSRRIQFVVCICLSILLFTGCQSSSSTSGHAPALPTPTPLSAIETKSPHSVDAGTSNVTATLSAAFAPDPAILFIAGVGILDHRNVYRYNFEKGDILCLTCSGDDARWFNFPVWAPGMDSYAVHDDFGGQMVIVTWQGYNITLPLPPGDYEHLAWSPDGSMLAFSLNDEICLITVSSDWFFGPVECIAVGSEPAWSPDSAELVYVSRAAENDPGDLYRIRLSDRQRVQITNSVDFDETAPDWYGGWIVFVNRVDGIPDIWLMNADGSGEAVCLTPGPLDGDQPDWSPDGTQIAFVSTRDSERQTGCEAGCLGYSNLFVMDADGSNVVNLTGQPRINVQSPDWSPGR